MGKVKRLRQKYHASLSSKNDDKNGDTVSLPLETPKLVASVKGAAPESVSNRYDKHFYTWETYEGCVILNQP